MDGTSTSLSRLSLLLGPRLGEEFHEAGGGEAGVAELGQHVAEIGPRVHAQPVAAEDEGVDAGGPVAGRVAAQEKPVLAAEDNELDEALHLPVVHRQAPILQALAHGAVALRAG